MKKEDKKYYALSDGTLREIPDGMQFDINSEKDFNDVAEIFYSLPAIYTDEKFPVGVVEGELTIKKQWLREKSNEWLDLDENRAYNALHKTRLFATRKREEVKDGIEQYQRLFNAISNTGSIALQSEMDDIIRIVHQDFPKEQGREEILIEALKRIEKLYHPDRTCSLPAQGYNEQECEQIGLDDYAAQIAKDAIKDYSLTSTPKQ